MSAVLSRSSYNEVEFLSPNLCTISRKPGALILPNNFGSFSLESNQLVIPAVNVGTILRFVRPIIGWKYLRITVQGLAQKINFLNAAGMVVSAVDMAAQGIDIGTVTMYVPACGPIQSITFDNLGPCLVSEIKAVFDIVYNLERRDDEQLRIVADADGVEPEFTEDEETGTINYIVPALGLFTAHFVGEIAKGYQGRCKIEIDFEGGGLVKTQAFTIFDGELIYANKDLAPAIAIFREGPVSPVAFVKYTNDYNWPMVVKLTPTVSYFMPVSTTYGSVKTPPIDDTQSFLIMPYLDNWNGPQSSATNHISDTNANYAPFDGMSTNLELSGGGLLRTPTKGTAGSIRVTKKVKSANCWVKTTINTSFAGTRTTGSGIVSMGVRVSANGNTGYFLRLQPHYHGNPFWYFWYLDKVVNGVQTHLYSFTLNLGSALPTLTPKLSVFQNTLTVSVEEYPGSVEPYVHVDTDITEPGFLSWTIDAYPDVDTSVVGIVVAKTEANVALA